MVSLHFYEGVSGRDSIEVGPAPWFRVTASYIRKGPHGTIVGSFRGTLWEVEGRHYKSFECRSPARVRFESVSGCTAYFGPFRHLRVGQSEIVGDSGLLARFTEDRRRWQDLATGGEWPDILILPED